jgi:D-glycero-alpha-D-manno-heptose-7-phosphate kinase
VRIDSSAPTRIDLAGATFDIWPLYLYHARALTLNVAISLRAHCCLQPRPAGGLAICSKDTDRAIDVAHWSQLDDLVELGLVGRILRFFEVDGLSITTHSDSPVGAGIAGSSALDIAVCGALDRWTGGARSDDELLALAMNVEAQAIGVPTGVQDYRPALYGGVAAVELGVDRIRRVALDVDVDALNRRLVVAFTGASRNSGLNNWEITKRHIDGDRRVFDAFERIRDEALAIRRALLDGDWAEVARGVDAEWTHRKRLAPGVTTPAIDDLIARARSAGAAAAKVCGAGGGGCLFCLAPPDATPAVRAALADGGARLLDCHVEPRGLVVEVHGERHRRPAAE